MKVMAIPTKMYDSAETPLTWPSLSIMNTTISEKTNVFTTKIVLGIMSAKNESPSPMTENPRIIANAAP